MDGTGNRNLMYKLSSFFKNVRFFHVIVVVILAIPSTLYVFDTVSRWQQESRIERVEAAKIRAALAKKQKEDRERARRTKKAKELARDRRKQEIALVSKGSSSILRTGIYISKPKLDYSRYKSWVEPYYETEYVNGRSVSRKKGGLYKHLVDGAIIKFKVTNKLKSHSVTLKGRYSFKTKFTKADKACPAKFRARTFSGTYSIKLKPGETKKISLYKSTKTKGKFYGLCLNILGVVPTHYPNLDFKSLKITNTSATARIEY